MLSCLQILEAFLWFVLFFFQAEDGIRDADVTEVQTCALPISVSMLMPSSCLLAGGAGPPGRNAAARGANAEPAGPGPAACDGSCLPRPGPGRGRGCSHASRSEERRVGKECRCRWSPYHEEKE